LIDEVAQSAPGYAFTAELVDPQSTASPKKQTPGLEPACR
jgi:hypothetical protein